MQRLLCGAGSKWSFHSFKVTWSVVHVWAGYSQAGIWRAGQNYEVDFLQEKFTYAEQRSWWWWGMCMYLGFTNGSAPGARERRTALGKARTEWLRIVRLSVEECRSGLHGWQDASGWEVMCNQSESCLYNWFLAQWILCLLTRTVSISTVQMLVLMHELLCVLLAPGAAIWHSCLQQTSVKFIWNILSGISSHAASAEMGES